MSEKENAHSYETLERYCHIIGKNTTVSRHRAGRDRLFTCSNLKECEKNGGCKNCMCKSYSADNGGKM